MRLLLKSCQFMAGAFVPWPPQAGRVQKRFSGDSTTRSHFTAPRVDAGHVRALVDILHIEGARLVREVAARRE